MVDEYLSEREQAERLKNWLHERLNMAGCRRSIDARRLLWISLVGIAGGIPIDRGWRTIRRHARCDWRGQARGRTAHRRRTGREVRGHAVCRPGGTRAREGRGRCGQSRERGDATRKSGAGFRGPGRGRWRACGLARVQLAEGRYDDALDRLDAVSTPSVDARVLELRGDVKLAQGDSAAALDNWRKAAATAATPEAGAMVDAELLQLKIDELGATQATE